MNARGIGTHWTPPTALTNEEDAQVRQRSEQHDRSRRYRAKRGAQANQERFL